MNVNEYINSRWEESEKIEEIISEWNSDKNIIEEINKAGITLSEHEAKNLNFATHKAGRRFAKWMLKKMVSVRMADLFLSEAEFLNQPVREWDRDEITAKMEESIEKWNAESDRKYSGMTVEQKIEVLKEQNGLTKVGDVTSSQATIHGDSCECRKCKMHNRMEMKGKYSPMNDAVKKVCKVCREEKVAHENFYYQATRNMFRGTCKDCEKTKREAKKAGK